MTSKDYGVANSIKMLTFAVTLIGGDQAVLIRLALVYNGLR